MTKPCTRCGQCCRAIPYGIGLCVFGDIRPCPALIDPGDGETSCGLITHPAKYLDIGGDTPEANRAAAAVVSAYIGIGWGCCNNRANEELSRSIATEFTKAKKEKP